MPNIRDLGITAIPGTNLPWQACNGDKQVTCGPASTTGQIHTACANTHCRDASRCDKPAKEKKEGDKKKASGAFTPEAVAQLRKQLEARISP